jgi:hypothetical protein
MPGRSGYGIAGVPDDTALTAGSPLGVGSARSDWPRVLPVWHRGHLLLATWGERI